MPFVRPLSLLVPRIPFVTSRHRLPPPKGVVHTHDSIFQGTVRATGVDKPSAMTPNSNDSALIGRRNAESCKSAGNPASWSPSRRAAGRLQGFGVMSVPAVFASPTSWRTSKRGDKTGVRKLVRTYERLRLA